MPCCSAWAPIARRTCPSRQGRLVLAADRTGAAGRRARRIVLRLRLRLAGDQAARHAFAMITMGLGELVSAAALMFMGFFGGEGGIAIDRVMDTSLFGVKYTSPWQVYCLVLAWAFIAAAADAAADPDAARQHGQRHPRQFRARPVRRLRSAHGAALSVRAVGLFRRHRRRAVRADLRNRHLRHRVGGQVGQRAARRLYRRRRRLLRTDPRHHRGGAAAERRQPAQQRLAALCRRAVHRDGDVRAGRADRADLHACADLARRAAARTGRCPMRGHSPRRCWCCSASCCWSNWRPSPPSARRRARNSRSRGHIIDTTAPLPWVVAIAALVLRRAVAAPRGPQLPRSAGTR